MVKKNKKTKKIVIFSIIAILVIGVISFLIFNGSVECNPGEDKCDESIYFICQGENFVNQGEIAGKCGVAEEQWKETFYRFSDNSCSAVSIYPDDKYTYDYPTLEECQENVVIPEAGTYYRIVSGPTTQPMCEAIELEADEVTASDYPTLAECQTVIGSHY